MAPRPHPAKDQGTAFLKRCVSRGWSAKRALEEAQAIGHATLSEMSERSIARRMRDLRTDALRRAGSVLDKAVALSIRTLMAAQTYQLTDVTEQDPETGDARLRPLGELDGEARILKSLSIDTTVTELGTVKTTKQRTKVEVLDPVSAAGTVLRYAAMVIDSERGAISAPDPQQIASALEAGIDALASGAAAAGGEPGADPGEPEAAGE